MHSSTQKDCLLEHEIYEVRCGLGNVTDNMRHVAYSWGILQAAFVADKVGSASTLSFVGSVTVVFIAVLAIANVRLIRYLGAQKTALLGVSLLGLGEISASFATKNIGGLFATAGVITGIGTRLVTIRLWTSV